MELITLSNTEIQRLELVQAIIEKRISVVDAASHLGLSRSQVHRLLSRYKLYGVSGLVSQKRSKPSNRRYSDALREHVLYLVQEHYHDFGPTLAAEKLDAALDMVAAMQAERDNKRSLKAPRRTGQNRHMFMTE